MTSKLTLDTNQFDENDCIQLQHRLWIEDITLCPKEEIAEYLGSKYIQVYQPILYIDD
jgi:hypothetical protein